MATLELTSFLDGVNLGEIPVVSGSWVVRQETGVTVPGSVEFDVPAEDAWIPLRPDHPLQGMGQRVRARVDQDGTGWRTWGWYRLARPKREGAVIRCSGAGLLREAERFRLTESWQTVTGNTRAGVLRALLAGVLPVVIDGVTDEAMPVTLWEEDRLAAVWEIIESWPARAELREQTLWVLPAWNDAAPGTPTGQLVDGAGGVLVELQPTEDNADPFNGYVASTVPAGDETAVVRLWTMPDGPMRWGGPYGRNPGFHASPLNPSDPAKLLAIAERLTRRAVAVGMTCEFTALPTARFELGQVVSVRSARHRIDGVGRILSLDLTRAALSGRVAML